MRLNLLILIFLSLTQVLHPISVNRVRLTECRATTEELLPPISDHNTLNGYLSSVCSPVADIRGGAGAIESANTRQRQ